MRRIAAVALALTAFTASLGAWKSVVHVHLAMMVRADALDDGRVTIYEMDYANGRFATDAAGTRKIIGTYPVNPVLLEAIRRYPQQFKAGALGPDAFPDILTGQTGIHPDNSARGHADSDDWLKLVWREALKVPSQQVRAFAVGFLTHAAGDLYGHTFVNNYSGGPFAIGENALKHIVLENYIDKRTPIDGPDFWDFSIEGVEGFLYRQLVVGPLIPPASATDIADHPTYFFNYALPRIFINLKGFVNSMHTACSAEVSRLGRQISRDLSDANACKVSDPPRAAALTARAAEQKIEKTAAEAADAYLMAWIRDIEAGQRAWPAFGHDLAKAALFNPGGFDSQGVSDACRNYYNHHLLSMLGAPDVVGEKRAFMKKVRDYIDSTIPDWLEEIIHFLRTDFEMYIVEKAWGLTLEMLTWPEVHFDPVMNNGLTDNKGERITLRDFNRNVLKIDDAAFFTRKTYDWTDIPAMVNSVTMMKLLLLSREGLQRLIDDLEQKGYTSNGFSPLLMPGPDDVPAVLGFMASLDDDNQWCRGPKMLFARDGCAYRRLFMRQTGEDVPSSLEACELAADGSVTQAPFPRPIASGHGSPMSAVIEASGMFRMWGNILKGGLHKRFPGEEALRERFPQFADPVAVSVGDDDFLALCRDGTVWTWGLHLLPAFGSWIPVRRYTPQRVPHLESITMIAAGHSHRLALRSNGTVWSWGDYDQVGQLGQGPGYHSGQTPRRVRGIGGIVFISAGRSSSLAVDSRGEVYKWGFLGEAGRLFANLPEKVPGLADVIAVDAGDDHSLALKKDGTVWAWGSNKYMQLGDGTTADRTQAVQVQGVDRVQAIAAGRHFSAALKNDGTVWVWGRGDHRELWSVGMPVRIKAPTKAEGLPPIIDLDAGPFHVVALDRDGNIWEWGHTWVEPRKYSK